MITDIRLVAARELREKLRDRAFWGFTAFMLLMPLLGGVVGGLLTGGEQRYTVAVVGQQSQQLGQVVTQRASAVETPLELTTQPDRVSAKQAVRDGEADAAIVAGNRVLTDGGIDPVLRGLLRSSAEQLATAQALREAGATPEQARQALSPAPLTVTNVAGGEQGQHAARVAVAMTGTVLLFLAIFLYGYWIASGVMEEKSSRVIEVVLSTVRPTRLLAGKAVGIGALGVGQLVVLIVAAVVAARVAGLPLPDVALPAVVSLVGWFILGFALYGCLFAVAGSLATKQEDLQYTQTPIMLLIFASYGIAVYYQLGNIDPVLMHVLAFVPPFTPFLMPVLVALGEAPVWEVALAVVVMIAATAGLVRVAARLYTGSLLRFGRRVSLREAWR